MTLTQKVINSLLFLIAVPLIRFATKLMLLRMENYYRKNNQKALPFVRNYKRIMTLVVNYVFTSIIVLVVISIWLFN